MYTTGLWHPSYGISTSWVMEVKQGKLFLSQCQMGLYVLDQSSECVSEWVSERVNEWVNTCGPSWQLSRSTAQIKWHRGSRNDWPSSFELPSRTTIKGALQSNKPTCFTKVVTDWHLDKYMELLKTMISRMSTKRLQCFQEALKMSENFFFFTMVSNLKIRKLLRIAYSEHRMLEHKYGNMHETTHASWIPCLGYKF